MFACVAAGEVLSLDVVSTDTVLSLKEKIREAQGIPVAQQRLEFTPIEYNWKSTKLSRNEAKLSEVSMTDGAELHLTVKVLGEGPMELIVRAITGTEYIIEVEKTDTILKFKENLQDFSGINPDQQILSTKEKGKLDNDKTVADYGLEDGALVDLKLILLF